jgi:hypothetical protein
MAGKGAQVALRVDAERAKMDANLVRNEVSELQQAHELTVQPGVYLPPPPSSKGAAARGRARKRKAA